MNKKLLTGLCIMILLLSSLVFASRPDNVVAEITSVSRLVGETPYDLINQLDTKQLNLHHATRLSNRDWVSEVTSPNMIRNFPEGYTIRGDGANTSEGVWYGYDHINEELDKFKPNELFVLDSYIDDDFGVYSMNLFKSDKIYPRDVKEWVEAFSINNPLFLFNVEFVGSSLPNQPSYINELTRYSTIIAPKSVRSAEFSNAVLCNLYNNQRIGDIYRRARTKYYTGTKPKSGNMPGIVLKSYSLYGNPLTRIVVPDEYEEYIKKGGWLHPCNKYYVPPSEYLFGAYGIQSAKEFKFENHLSFDYGIVNIPDSNYQVIESSDLIHDYENPNLVGLYTIRTHRLPKGSFVKGINSTFSNPAGLNIPGYPSMSDGNFTERNCFELTQEEAVDIQTIEKDNYDEIIVNINPLRISNCDSGSLVLFSNLFYSLNYLPSAPFFFDNLEYKEVDAPGSKIDLSFDLEYVSDDPLNGKILLLEGNNTAYEKNINQRLDKHKISFHLPGEEGISDYILQYVENNTVKTSASFSIETRILDSQIIVGEFDGNSANLKIEFLNYFNRSLPVLVRAEIVQGFVQIYNQEKVLTPGRNLLNFHINNLRKEDISYSLKIYIEYENKQKMFSDIIVTNNPPVINVDDMFLRVGELIEPSPEVYDADDDEITVTISPDEYPRLAEEADIGQHNITIEASDGLVTTTRQITLTVIPANYEPELYEQRNLTIYEGDIASVILYAEDSDGDELNYSIENLNFIQVDYNWFEWWTQEGDAGNYTISYSVNDGKAAVTKEFSLEIMPYDSDCADVTCDDYCSGFTHYSEGRCSNGECTYSNVEPSSQNCRYEEPEELVIRHFSDGESSKAIDVASNSTTVYIRVPKNALISSATYTITGK